MKTLDLINAIKLGEIDSPIDDLIKLAAQNKILLHFLRRINIYNDVRAREEYRYKYFIDSLKEINSILYDSRYEYAFFKLYKPVEYVPADIDILVSINDITKIVKEFIRHRYNLEVLEPYTATLTRDKVIIDLYTYPSLGNIIYLDGQKLLDYKKNIVFNDIEIISLETYAEAIVTLTHALDKEWIYTLNDYFTVSKWLSKKSIRLCEELNCRYEIKLARRLNKDIENGYIETPYKIPKQLIFQVWSNKIRNNKHTRATLIKSLSWLNDKRLGKSIISKLTRVTY